MGLNPTALSTSRVMNQDWLVLRSEESFGQDLPRGVVTLTPSPSGPTSRPLGLGEDHAVVGGRPPKVDPVRYRQRNVVERAIARLKQHRAIATRTTSWLSVTHVVGAGRPAAVAPSMSRQAGPRRQAHASPAVVWAWVLRSGGELVGGEGSVVVERPKDAGGCRSVTQPLSR